ncbi:MAG: class SAM-dependent methyltransferase, partial [Nocardioides sp.]|nr:class SAM-dependent methyltransferase [Nocardioides sp.]
MGGVCNENVPVAFASRRADWLPLAPLSFPLVTVPDHREQTQQGYDAIAVTYARLLPALNAETSLDIAMIDGFADRCASARLGPVADAGCGTGRVSAHLVARGLDVIGIDLSPGMIDVARRTYPELNFEVGALEELPFPDDTLGGLVAWYSIIHSAPERLPVIVAQAARALRPGAWFLGAFQAGDGQRVDRTSAHGQPMTMTNYRHDPDQQGSSSGAWTAAGWRSTSRRQRSSCRSHTPRASGAACRARCPGPQRCRGPWPPAWTRTSRRPDDGT